MESNERRERSTSGQMSSQLRKYRKWIHLICLGSAMLLHPFTTPTPPKLHIFLSSSASTHNPRKPTNIA